MRVEWDIYEAAILLRACLDLQNESGSRIKVVREISSILRTKAQIEGKQIDNKFRNETGISAQMFIMNNMLTGKRNVRKPNKVFKQIVDLYFTNYQAFENILDIAKSKTSKQCVDDLKEANKTTKITRKIVRCAVLSDTNAPLKYTVPISYVFSTNKAVFVDSWKMLYVSIMSMLIKEYPNFLYPGVSFTGSSKPDIETKDYVHTMISPKEISKNVYVETNLSAQNVFKKLQLAFNLCGVDPTLLKIDYEKEYDVLMNTPENNKLDVVIDTLKNEYPTGFKFDLTAIRLLSEKAHTTITPEIIDALKNRMFCRCDDVYFLNTFIAPTSVIDKIITTSTGFLASFGGFELQIVYNMFKRDFADNHIRTISDFEDFFKHIYNDDIRCVGKYNTRIVRKKDKNLDEIFRALTQRIVIEIKENYGGAISEDDLLDMVPGFSSDLLNLIFSDYSEELIRTSINDTLCYQTLESLGLGDSFSMMLSSLLIKLDELNIPPTDDAIQIALSLETGVNFRTEYNIDDDKTFRRLISMYYNDSPKREWKSRAFLEVN